MSEIKDASLRMDTEHLWQGFLNRDRELDGMVVCAVRSTKIYCRPTCPARRPARSQVSFYSSAREAREAGYRACLRCLPDRTETDAELVSAACRFVDEFVEVNESLPRVEEVAQSAGLSPGRLQRLFRGETGLTVPQYAKASRLKRFKELVKESSSVSDATFGAGYASSSRLYENARRRIGMTPATYKKGGAGAEIQYLVAESALGGLLVAGTSSGVCAVKLGDDSGALLAELKAEFPAAVLTEAATVDSPAGGNGLRKWVSALLQYLEGIGTDIDLPLDVVATAFQWRVWRKLQAIPAGETRTYQDMAGDLGQPSASRAVGRACATNPVAPIIPCHRAVRKDGGLAGYRWGLHRKEALLKMERDQANTPPQ